MLWFINIFSRCAQCAFVISSFVWLDFGLFVPTKIRFFRFGKRKKEKTTKNQAPSHNDSVPNYVFRLLNRSNQSYSPHLMQAPFSCFFKGNMMVILAVASVLRR